MDGKQLRFVLSKIGLTYAEFGKLCGKSEPTIQRWVSNSKDIGLLNENALRAAASKKQLEKLEAEWEEMQANKAKK